MDFLLFSDLPHDLIHDKIGAYLLKDPNKKSTRYLKIKKMMNYKYYYLVRLKI
jgi:hypothetical protein